MPSYRVYFNRKAEAPQVFSIDEGDQTTESNVSHVEGHGVSFKFHYDPSVKINPDTPTAWMTVESATLQMLHGVAHFYPHSAWLPPEFSEYY